MTRAYKFYGTDLTQAHHVLKEAGYDCEPKETYLVVTMLEDEKNTAIKLFGPNSNARVLNNESTFISFSSCC